jgi:hypothetical protein
LASIGKEREEQEKEKKEMGELFTQQLRSLKDKVNEEKEKFAQMEQQTRQKFDQELKQMKAKLQNEERSELLQAFQKQIQDIRQNLGRILFFLIFLPVIPFIPPFFFCIFQRTRSERKIAIETRKLGLAGKI